MTGQAGGGEWSNLKGAKIFSEEIADARLNEVNFFFLIKAAIYIINKKIVSQYLKKKKRVGNFWSKIFN